jgi:hypothetical protein
MCSANHEMAAGDIYLKALRDIQDICFPILGSRKYDTGHSQIAQIASQAIHSANDQKLNGSNQLLVKTENSWSERN